MTRVSCAMPGLAIMLAKLVAVPACRSMSLLELLELLGIDDELDFLHGEEPDGDGKDKKVGQNGLAVAVALGKDGR